MSLAFPADPKNPVNPALKDTSAQNASDSQPDGVNTPSSLEEVVDTTPEATTTEQATSTPAPPTEEDTTEDVLSDPQASDAGTGGYDDTDAGISSDSDVHAL